MRFQTTPKPKAAVPIDSIEHYQYHNFKQLIPSMVIITAVQVCTLNLHLDTLHIQHPAMQKCRSNGNCRLQSCVHRASLIEFHDAFLHTPQKFPLSTWPVDTYGTPAINPFAWNDIGANHDRCSIYSRAINICGSVLAYFWIVPLYIHEIFSIISVQCCRQLKLSRNEKMVVKNTPPKNDVFDWNIRIPINEYCKIISAYFLSPTHHVE